MTNISPGGTVTSANRRLVHCRGFGGASSGELSCTYGSSMGAPLTVIRPLSSQQATLSPGRPITRLMKSRSPGRLIPTRSPTVRPSFAANAWLTGSVTSVDRWGDLQVTIVVRKTTTITGAKKRVTRKITAVSVPIYPNHTDRSIYINQTALPILKSEALRAQSANINMVSGATDTSDAFAQSLQAAILKAKKS